MCNPGRSHNESILFLRIFLVSASKAAKEWSPTTRSLNRAFPILLVLYHILTLNSQFRKHSETMRLKSDNIQFWIVYTSLRVLTLTCDNHSTEELHCLFSNDDVHQLRAIHTGEHQFMTTLLSKRAIPDHYLPQSRKGT